MKLMEYLGTDVELNARKQFAEQIKDFSDEDIKILRTGWNMGWLGCVTAVRAAMKRGEIRIYIDEDTFLIADR